MTRVPFAFVLALALGGLTSLAQAHLPYDLAPLANSAGPWCAVAWALALLVPRIPAAVVVAGGSLVGLVAGYYLVSRLRGYGVSEAHVAFWLLAALTVGPALGLAAAWLGRDGLRGWYAVLALPVLLVAEGVRSLRTVAETTSSAYWTGEIVVGVVLAVVLAVVPAVVRPRVRSERTAANAPGRPSGNT